MTKLEYAVFENENEDWWIVGDDGVYGPYETQGKAETELQEAYPRAKYEIIPYSEMTEWTT